jgi:hypothetical protein
MAGPNVLIVRPFQILNWSVFRAHARNTHARTHTHTHTHTHSLGNLINLKEKSEVKLIFLYLNFSSSLIYLKTKVSDDITCRPSSLGES